MAKAKQMNASYLAKLVKELNASGEFIRARQNEKQAVINSFDKEKKRYSAGKISESTLVSSMKKINKELIRLDKAIRQAIKKTNSQADVVKKFSSGQAPKVFRAHVIGVTKSSSKSKKKSKTRRVVKRKKGRRSSKKPARSSKLRVVLMMEKQLDARYQRA